MFGDAFTTVHLFLLLFRFFIAIQTRYGKDPYDPADHPLPGVAVFKHGLPPEMVDMKEYAFPLAW